MDYRVAIRQNTNKQQLTFDELASIIAGLAGDAQKDGTMTINSQDLDQILKSFLGENSTTGAWLHHNNPEVQARLNWHYDTNKGEGYFTTK